MTIDSDEHSGHRGGYSVFWVLPFGLHGAPATFQRLIDQVWWPVAFISPKHAFTFLH